MKKFWILCSLVVLACAGCVTPASQRLGRVPASSDSSAEEKPEEEAAEAEESEEAEEAEESEVSDDEVDDSKPF
ncbi:MAG: hypothetical protein ACQEVA_16195 [Myxococcota bacterium]